MRAKLERWAILKKPPFRRAEVLDRSDADPRSEELWLSGTGQVVGWINTKILQETGDAAKAQGWSPFVLDTNGNGRRDEHVEPNQPIDPTKDKRIVTGSGPYPMMPSPVDGSVWYTVGVLAAHPPCCASSQAPCG